MITKTICLFRHGETEWNRENRRQGQHDSALTEKGRLQALSNAHKMQSRRNIDDTVAIYCSPLGRTKQTAMIMVDALGLPRQAIEYDPRLMESSFGQWEGLTEDEVKLRFPISWAARSENRWDVQTPGGESYADVHARVADWYSTASFAETNIIVSHGLTSRVFRGIYGGLSHQEVLELDEPQDGYYELSNGTEIFVE